MSSEAKQASDGAAVPSVRDTRSASPVLQREDRPGLGQLSGTRLGLLGLGGKSSALLKHSWAQAPQQGC